MLIFVGSLGFPKTHNVLLERGTYDRKEGQVETRLGPEEAVARHGHGMRAPTRPGLFGTPHNYPRSSTWSALTFDDGPDPAWTPRILAALDRARARATSFVIAPLAVEHQNIVAAAREAGHEVQFHCTEHARHTRRSRREVEDDTREGLEMLRSLGVEPRLWRPPWGVLAPWTQELGDDFGLRLAHWSADTHDWRGDPAPEMLRRVEPLLGPGSVVLMHDGLGPGARRSGCDETVALVDPLVARLRGMGCEPATLSGSEPRQTVPGVDTSGVRA